MAKGQSYYMFIICKISIMQSQTCRFLFIKISKKQFWIFSTSADILISINEVSQKYGTQGQSTIYLWAFKIPKPFFTIHNCAGVSNK